MSLIIKLATRGLTLFVVLLVVLLLVVITLGATGFSERMLQATISEELRGLRQSLAQTIRDPAQLEEALSLHHEELISYYHLDKPWSYRLPDLVRRVLTLDLGEARTLRSFEGSSQVSEIVAERLLNTILLVTTASVITAILGLLIGPRLATKVGSRLDRVACLFLAFSYALPSMWVGIFLILAFSFSVNLFPTGGMYSLPPPEGGIERFMDLLWHAVLPIVTLVLVSFGSWTYTIRTMVLNTAQEPFVSVGRAKGLPERMVERRYILRVAAPPIVTSLMLGLAGSLGGAILTETVFNWPGMGRLYYDAILAADESVIVALTFIFTLIYIFARFILEILYLILDPRIRYA